MEKNELDATVTYGIDDVFHELGSPDADELLAKSKLAIAIQSTIDERSLTQSEAAKLMGIDQPKVSKIVRGRLAEFSTERLLTFLIRLGLDVEIVIHRRTAQEPGAGSIHVAYG